MGGIRCLHDDMHGDFVIAIAHGIFPTGSIEQFILLK